MMNPTRRLGRAFAALVLAAFGLAGAAAAQGAGPAAGYPARPITIVVGFPPSGATDLIARMVANKLSEAFGQPVIVDNRPGAGSNIATEYVVHAKPDGYTLLVETIANASNVSVYKNLRFDALKDLSPIIQFMSSPSVLVVSPKVPATDLKSLIALAKAQPGKLSYASSGIGGSPHLAGEMLKMRAGIDILHVPYKGAAPALTDVMSGNVSMGFMTSLGALQFMQNGQLRPIAVAFGSRLPELPNVPTMAEAGLPDFEVSSWNGLAAPAGTPQPIIDKLNREVGRILALPDVRQQLQTLGAQAVGGSSQQFAAYVKSEAHKWGEVVRAANISLN